LRFEADTEEELGRIKTVFRNQLKAVDSSLPVPFCHVGAPHDPESR
ncbi:hypothetical protein, partial [Pseudomonas aeruginosa]